MIVPPPRSHKYECQFQECFPLPGISHRTKYCSGGAIVIIPRPHCLSVCTFVTCVSGGQYLSPAFITQVSPCSRKGSVPPWLSTNHESGIVQLTNSRTGITIAFLLNIRGILCLHQFITVLYLGKITKQQRPQKWNDSSTR